MRGLAVIGNLSRDVVAGGPPRPGGAPYYGARALRLLGVRSLIVTKCAEEHRSELVPPLVALGVPVTCKPAQATPAFSFDYDGDRRRMTVEALGDPWTAEDASGWVAEALAGAAWLHVGSLLRGDFPRETLAELARGRRLSLDGQGLVRARRVGPLALDREFDRRVLDHVSILKLAEEEAVALVERTDASSLGSLGVPEILVTRGARGATVLADGAVVDVPARPVATADPTGAGDVLAVAYLASRSAGSPPASAARRATALVAALLAGRGR